MIDCPYFAKSCVAARALAESNPMVSCEINQFFQTQWEEHLRKTASSKKGAFYEHTASPLITLNDNEYLGSNEEFNRYALINFNYLDKTPFEDYVKMAASTYREKINHSTETKYAQFMFNINGVDSQVVIELFE